jgi:hypothetical protein
MIPTPYHLLILALAAYRVTRLITHDTIFNSLRERIWKRSPPENNRLGYWITCEWCASIWVASTLVVMYIIATEATVVICCALAVSAVVGSLYRIS